MKLSGFKSLLGIVAASCVALTGPVVRAAGAEQPSTRGDETEPAPPPGASRLISIGPQALVREDDHGNLTMVDEPEPQSSKSQVAGIMLGAMTAGVLVVFSATYRTVRGADD
ncbi:MAG TPA: hypothetical protein VLA79_18580 [Polyangia bacterium]|nr:hypothetical protein [Polyangia bacterium]